MSSRVGMAGDTSLNCPHLWLEYFPTLKKVQNKYDRGHVLVVSGGLTSTGAARLATRSALRAGAGLVTLASPTESLSVNAAASLAVMVRVCDNAKQLSNILEDKRINAVVLGPGGGVGEAMLESVKAALQTHAAVVLDADALTSFENDATLLAETIKQRNRFATILTPHEGEFARLFHGKAFLNSATKHERAIAAAKEMHAIIVLKGANTVVAAPDGQMAIAENAPTTLATAGSGDVLAGMIAGLLAQGMPAFMAAAAGVWLHGEAANLFGLGLISEDLPEMLPKVFQQLAKG